MKLAGKSRSGRTTAVKMTSRTREFNRLCAEAEACVVCPRLAHKKAVLSRLNGSLTPRVLFIGEAPGRRGADRTRRPFTGDQSGRRFDELLASVPLTREDIFITMAVLCCPCDENSNLTPNRSEISHCSSYLARTLDLLKPRVVATVGAIALGSLGKLLGRRFSLSEQAGTIIQLDQFALVPLYHVSPRVLHTTRNLDQQHQDFAAIRQALAE